MLKNNACRLSYRYLGSSPGRGNSFVREHTHSVSASQLTSCYRGANPDFGSDELLYQIQISNAKLILVHPDALETAVSAARSAGIPLDHVIVFNIASKRTPEGFRSISDLVRAGLDQELNFVEPNIDARTKLAFLSFSSGMF